jgi:exodeoxyribonuclease VII small subunit
MPPKSFEERLARLEQIAASLREGQIPLEEALALFEEGTRLARALEKELSRAERRIQILAEDQPAEPEAGPRLELFPEDQEEEEG